MKKNLLLLGLAVAAMTSCTNEEVLSELQESPKAISFDSFVNKATRAVTPTDANISKFYAYAYYDADQEVFDGEEVTKSDSKWKYTHTAYWTQNVYQFAAYADGNNGAALEDVAFADGTLTIPSYTVTDAKDLVADVITKNNSNFGAAAQDVQFTFEHLLTKVKFNIINTSRDYKMKITALTVTGAKATGQVDVTANGAVWTGDPDANAATYTPVAASADAYIAKYVNNSEACKVSSEEMFVMPQDLANVKFSITATFYDDNDQVVATKTFTNAAFAGKNRTDNDTKEAVEAWAPGTSYEYTLSLPVAARPIVFGQPTIATWAKGGIVELNPDDNDEGVQTPEPEPAN